MGDLLVAKAPGVQILPANMTGGGSRVRIRGTSSLSLSNDPIFVIEANFDGPPAAFWGHVEATLADRLRPMLRCCKRPADDDGPAYDAVTKPDSRAPVVAYLQRRTLRPSVFHQGNRGLERDRILRERDLFLAIRGELAQASPTAPNPYRAIPAEQIHVRLRNAL